MEDGDLLTVGSYLNGEKYLEFPISEEVYEGIWNLRANDKRLLSKIIEIILEMFLRKGS